MFYLVATKFYLSASLYYLQNDLGFLFCGIDEWSSSLCILSHAVKFVMANHGIAVSPRSRDILSHGSVYHTVVTPSYLMALVYHRITLLYRLVDVIAYNGLKRCLNESAALMRFVCPAVINIHQLSLTPAWSASRYELSQRTIKAIKVLAIAAISLIVKTNSLEWADVQDLHLSLTSVMEKEVILF